MANNQGQQQGGGNQGGRGFAGMDDQKQREIARKGGEASGGNQGGRGGGDRSN